MEKNRILNQIEQEILEDMEMVPTLDGSTIDDYGNRSMYGVQQTDDYIKKLIQQKVCLEMDLDAREHHTEAKARMIGTLQWLRREIKEATNGL